MTTLAIMKDRIAREIRRSNLTAAIEEAIQTAIAQYQGKRFWWNDGREQDFTTVSGTEFYTEADIGATIWKIDYVVLYVSDQPYRLHHETAETMERLSMNNTQTGQPRYYCWYGDKLRLYPSPDGEYTVRMGGVISVSAPGADDEAGNVWMNAGEYLIRQRAKFEVAANILIDNELANTFGGLVEQELSRLSSLTANKQQSRGWAMTPTEF